MQEIRYDSDCINRAITEMSTISETVDDLESDVSDFSSLFSGLKSKPAFIDSYLGKIRNLKNFSEQTHDALADMLTRLEELEGEREGLNAYEEQYKSVGIFLSPTAAESILSAADKRSRYLLRTGANYSIFDTCCGDIDMSLNFNSTCCATFVATVLYKAGIVTKDEINGVKDGNYNYVPVLCDFFDENINFIEVPVDQMLPGDIAVESDEKHIQIYKGDNEWYSKGKRDMGTVTINENADRIEKVYRYVGPTPIEDEKSNN